MTFRKHVSMFAMLASISLGFLSCSDSGAESDPDAGTEQSEDPCTKFQNYAESCGISGTSLNYLNLACGVMDKFFIESFMSEMIDCFSPDSCDEFAGIVSSLSGGDTDLDLDAGILDSSFTVCAAAAVVNVEPEQANLDFKEHFCDYAVGCNDDLSRTECESRFADPGELFFYTVLEEPYITDADACVYPAPECSEADEVSACLNEVTASLTTVLDFLEK